MASVSMRLGGDEEYEVGIISYDPPTEATRDDPGDGGSIEIGTIRVWTRDPETLLSRVSRKVTLDRFLELYADYNVLAPHEAQPKLEEYLMEQIHKQYFEDYEDIE